MTELQDALRLFKEKEWVDLTHPINEQSPHFPALPALERKTLFTHEDGFFVEQYAVVGQYGTHIDPPIHFVKGARTLEEIALKDLWLPLYVIDKSQEVAQNPDYQLTLEDVLAFEAKHGEIQPGAFVAFRSDWSKRWPDQDRFRNLDEQGVQHTPGWTHEALEYLIHTCQVKAVGHETLDTDAGVAAAANGGALKEEYYLLSQDIYQVEVLNHLDRLPAVGAVVTIAFPHFEKGSGSPVRALAILP